MAVYGKPLKRTGIMNKTLIEQYIEKNFFGTWLGMTFTELAPGHIIYELTITENHLATPVATHGGVVAALVDATLGVSGLSAVQAEGKVVSTIEYKLNFLSPSSKGDTLHATGKIEQKGKSILVISCEVINKTNGKTVAKALGTFNCYDAEKAGYVVPFPSE